MPEPPGGGRAPERTLPDEVERKARRRIRARAGRRRGIWSWLGTFGLVGWSVAVPAVLGVLVGIWLDEAVGSPVSWTLTMLVVGVVLGCLNAWHWIRREIRDG